MGLAKTTQISISQHFRICYISRIRNMNISLRGVNSPLLHGDARNGKMEPTRGVIFQAD